MPPKSTNHFITVSRTGELWARRKGHPPVLVATAASGLEVATGADARARGAPPTVVVRFAHGGGNRELRVMAVVSAGEPPEPDAFLARYGVSAEALGAWIRAAVDRVVG